MNLEQKLAAGQLLTGFEFAQLSPEQQEIYFATDAFKHQRERQIKDLTKLLDVLDWFGEQQGNIDEH